MAHLAFATESRRVFVTQDADFLRLHAKGVAHTGIAYCTQGSVTPSGILRRLILIGDLLSPEEMMGRIEFL